MTREETLMAAILTAVLICGLWIGPPARAAEMPPERAPQQEDAWQCPDCLPGWMLLTVVELGVAANAATAATWPEGYGTALAVGAPLVAPLMLKHGASPFTTLTVVGGTVALGLYNLHEMDDREHDWGDVFRRNEVATHLYIFVLGSALALESIWREGKGEKAREAPPVGLILTPERMVLTANLRF